MRTRPFIFSLLILICSTFWSTQNQAQIYAPLANVKAYGYSYDMEPGFYNKPVYLKVSAPPKGRFKFKVAGGEGVNEYDNKPTAIIDSIATIAMQITVNGRWMDTIYVGTYFIRESVTLPIISLHLNRTDFDASGGILDGRLITIGDSAGRVSMRREGRVWQKHSIRTFTEFMDSTGTRKLGNMKIKPFGGMTIGSPEKGLRLVTDTTIGSRNIGINPFPTKPFRSYRTLVLRASGNDQNQTRMKDMSLASIAKDMGLDYMDYRPSILLVNGDYWGIYNIREKINHEYLYYNHKAPKNEKTTLLGFDGGG
ncbi:MAG: CotH kinase family protein, partial [Bacteroidota bacterium]